jgi:hypothetical protein
MFREPLETWEYWVYPLTILAVVGLRSWPLSFYWTQVLRPETLLWLGLGLFEIIHFQKRRPGLARMVLIALCCSLGMGLFVPGDPRLIYWITIGLCLYLAGLEWLSEQWERWNWRRKK